MKVALVQTSLHWENPQKNREHFTSIVNSIDETIDLIVLPEMFTSGFTMNPEHVAEPIDGQTIQWMKEVACKIGAAIMGSLVIKENEEFYNRLVFVDPQGKLESYDKRHLFTLAGENKIYAKGRNRKLIDYKGFRICPLICYDLRFPVFSRNNADYDLLIYVANWPEVREKAWDILLQARAVENQCFVVGVNRTGSDPNKNTYTGHSQAIDFLGNYLLEPQKKEGVYVIKLDKEGMLTTRGKLNFLSDQDRFTLEE